MHTYLKRSNLDILIIGANLIVWIVVPFVDFSQASTFATGLSIITCVWRPTTAMFLFGLMETCWFEGKFRDLLLTPGQMILFAILLRMFIHPGIGVTWRLVRQSPVWFKSGLLLYMIPTLYVSIYFGRSFYIYTTVAFVLSFVAIIGLLYSQSRITDGLIGFFIGLSLTSIYYIMGLIGLIKPIISYQYITLLTFTAGRMDSNAVAMSQVLFAVGVLFLIPILSNKLMRYTAYLLYPIAVIGTIGSGSRSGLMAIVVGHLLFIMIRNYRVIGKIVFTSTIAGLLLFILMGNFIQPSDIVDNFSRTTNRFTEEIQMDEQESFRKYMWIGAIDELRNHPFSPDYNLYRSKYILMSHNTFLEIALYGGVLASIGFLILIVGGIVEGFIRYRSFGALVYVLAFSLLIVRSVALIFLAMPGDKISALFIVLAFQPINLAIKSRNTVHDN